MERIEEEIERLLQDAEQAEQSAEFARLLWCSYHSFRQEEIWTIR